MWLNLGLVEDSLRTTALGRRLVYLTSTHSTQDVARSEAEMGAGEETVVLAEEQTAGRGRLGRSWVSPAGRNIYLTLVLRPDVQHLKALTMIAPLAVARAVEEVTELSPQLKWPNDILLSGRKLSGVLIDSEFSGSEVRYALVGIGLNVNFDIDKASEIGSIATSVKSELGREVSREGLLAALLNQFEALYRNESAVVVREGWKARLETIGRDVRVTFRGQTCEGVVTDVDADGSLILRRPDGSTNVIEAGEVTLREP